jgi:hypothetical protein
MLLDDLTYGKFFSTDGEGGGGAGANDGEGNNDGNTGANDNHVTGDGGDDLTALKSALDKERKAARDASKQLKSLQAELDQLRNAGKSEEEQREAALKSLQTEAERWKTRALESAARVAVSDAAAKANAIEPAAIFALVSRDIDYDDDGQPTNVADVIANARKAYPGLFRAAAGSGDGGKGGTGAEANDMNALIRRAAGRT